MNHFLYFTIDWIIDFNSIKNIVFLFGKVEELGCEIYLPEATQNDEGYNIERLIIHVPSQDIMNEFVKQGASLVGLLNWRSIPEPKQTLVPVHIRKLESNIYAAWIDGLRQRALENRNLQEKLKGNSSSLHKS